MASTLGWANRGNSCLILEDENLIWGCIEGRRGYELLRWLSGKESGCKAGDVGDMGSIPGSGRSAGGGNGNPLQYSCLENSMDREARWASAHGVAKSWTWLRIDTCRREWRNLLTRLELMGVSGLEQKASSKIVILWCHMFNTTWYCNKKKYGTS